MTQTNVPLPSPPTSPRHPHRDGVALPPPPALNRKHSGRRLRSPLLVAAALVAGAAGGSIVNNIDDGSATSAAAPLAGELTAATSQSGRSVTASGPFDLSELIAETAPSVVRIDAMTPVGASTGTGFVIDAEGTIVTNAHVVGDAATVEVTLADGSSKTARVLGRAVTEDLAVVDIEADRLPFLDLGSSADLRVGQPVVAIGNALGLDGGSTATDGIVSALERNIDIDGTLRLEHLIQTDAAINPGNSGGPLLDLGGRVVGINSAGSPYAQNIGFAIAIDDAAETIASLRDGVAVTRPFLGVTTTVVTPRIARRIGVETDTGVVITEVAIGSAAEAAGLRAGDVVSAVAAEPVSDGSDLAAAIDSRDVGDQLTLTVQRADQTLTVHVALSSRPA
ncbi:MAG: trypsin-like peptidase domain-containing protein [Ilumatobacter sp.]|uniref:S1C family serine protease n=1 Tax=Ilumatobacter sp. TaxID=1967498 RepID=UPI003C7265D2